MTSPLGSAANSLIIALLLAGCAGRTPSVDPAPASDPYSQVKELEPGSVGGQVLVATPLPPGAPALQETSIPVGWQAIREHNIQSLVPIARWGQGDLYQLAYSPDGFTLAAASSLGVHLLDPDTLALKAHIPSNQRVAGIAFSADGNYLAVGMWDGEIEIWDQSGERLEVLLKLPSGSLPANDVGPNASQQSPYGGTTAHLVEVGFSSDSSRLAALAGTDLYLIRTTDWYAERQGSGHALLPTDLSFSPDGATIATTGDAHVKLRRASDGALIDELTGHGSLGMRGIVRHLSFTPSGSMLATGGEDGEVKLWRMPDLVLQATFFGGPQTGMAGLEGITAMEFSPAGNIIAYGTDQGTITVRDITGPERWDLVAAGGVESLVFSPDGATIAALSSDNQILLWRAPEWEAAATASFGPGEIWGGADWIPSFSSDGSRLLWGGTVWDVDDAALSRHIAGNRLSLSRRFLTIPQLSPDGRWFAYVSGGNTQIIVIERLEDFAEVSSFAPAIEFSAFAFTIDGDQIFTGFWENRRTDSPLLVWDVRTGQVVDSKPFDNVDEIYALPGGQSVAIVENHYDRSTLISTTFLSLFDLPDLHRAWSHQLFTEYAFASSPSGESIALVTADEMRLLSVSSGVEIWSVKGVSPDSDGTFNAEILRNDAPAFSPDGSLIVTGGQELKVWRAEDGALIRVMDGTPGTIGPQSFSPDGRLLAVAHKGLLWLFGIGDAPATADTP